MGKKPNNPPGGKGFGGKGLGGRRQFPSKITASQYGAMRACLAKKHSFVREAIKNLPAAVPSLAKIFREIPAQANLTAAGKKQVREHLILAAVETEMFRQGLSPDWGAIRMFFFAETAQGPAQITIEKRPNGWKMWLRNQPTA